MKYKAKVKTITNPFELESFTLFSETQQMLATDETMVTVLTPVGTYSQALLIQEKANLQSMIDDIDEKLAAITATKNK